jgi:hypothetical protein
MADERYSSQPWRRFAREHKQNLPTDAHMIDCDGVIWVPYEPETGLPLMVIEVKPENPRERGWNVTRALAELAGLPAVLVFELNNGLYRIYVATPKTRYQPHLLRGELTIEEFYERVEKPLRERHDAAVIHDSIEEALP